MCPVIGTLTVDLEANTASFSGDLGKAAKSAEDFGKSASAAGQQVDYSMREAKGSMMLLGEELGVHIPRHLQALIAEIPMVGEAFAAMLPIVGVVAAIAIIAKLIAKTDEAKEKMALGWDKYDSAIQTVFNNLDDKLLAAGIRTDELAGNHLAALHKKLLEIDHASLKELVSSMDAVAKAADSMMAEMKSSWYEIQMGSQGAMSALDVFHGKYEKLLKLGKSKEAGDLLKGTRDSAVAHLSEMERLEKLGYVATQKKWQSQRLLVDALNEEFTAAQKIASLGDKEKTNVKTGEAQAEAGRQDAIYNEQQKGLEQRRKAEERYSNERKKLLEKGAKEDERMAEEQAKATEAVATSEMKVREGLANEALRNSEAGAKLTASAEEQAARHGLAMRQSTATEALAVELAAIQKRQKAETDALDRESAFLLRAGKRDEVKLKEIEDKKTQIIQQSANEQIKIRNAAEEKQFQDVSRAEAQMADAVARNVARSILVTQNMAQAFEQMGAQMLESAAANTIKMILLRDKDKLSSAEVSAAHTYATVSAIPIVGPILAPAAAAVAFAAVMAFEHGGEIPGSGPQPIIAHGGETVVTKALTDQVRGNRAGGSGNPITIHFPAVQALDADGVDGVLEKHAALIQRHVTNALRKQNRR